MRKRGMNEDPDCLRASSSRRTQEPPKVPASNGPFSWLGVIATALIYLMKSALTFLLRASRRTWSHLTKHSINASSSKSARVSILEDAPSCDDKLLIFLSRYQFKLKFVGLDCEWVSRKGCRNAPVALLQIATPENDCFLVRLCKMGGILPGSVRKILEDKTILKFGVGIQGDAKKLSTTYGVVVAGCVDLRHVVVRCRGMPGQPTQANKKMSLDALAEQILGVEMDKHWTTRCSNWEAEKLTERQADYAMNDALVAVHIFLKLVESKSKERHSPRSLSNFSPVERDAPSFRESVSSGTTHQIECEIDDDGGAEQNSRASQHGEESSLVDSLNKQNEESIDSVATDGLSLGLEKDNLSHSSDKPGRQPILEAEETQVAATPNIVDTPSNSIPSCRRRIMNQSEGSAVSGNKQSGTPDEITTIDEYEFNDNKGINETANESYYERFVSIDKWETRQEGGYVQNVPALLRDPLFCQRAVSLCQGITDMEFKATQKTKKQRSGDMNCANEKAKSKPYKRGTIRKTPLYSKSMLVAPDGATLCTLDRKKADWYILKGIGELISQDPYTVQLKFEPSGRPKEEDSYYLTFKENICVVCGRDESYLRKSIVPHDYRRYFPVCLKDHHCHDILLMCSECHSLSNFYDEQLRQKLAKEYNAPYGNATVARLVEDPALRKVKSAAKALLYASEKIPEKRSDELRNIIQAHYGPTDLSEEMILDAASLETRKENCDYISHGKEVVKKVEAEKKLLEFERMWRQNFLDNMNPQFLPPMWCVDHHHQKLKGILGYEDS